ncbi:MULTISPECIES: hypothetical protein [Ectothiorhodospira]|uniref:hypothetical protein n=1 Tax=Ectothiorhodospira TaxID=1051 RepID=UPI00024A8116|nr:MULTISPECIES: hypothetical protein [Ectothiorhodospira]EHQ52024.1 hypothetical protein ECTPHS_04985 [Ectothiorhodospira sp. PHS-1]MCG5511914.1 hypothetical protein [Ectothiorhodospira shaposhnikovii]
MATPIGFGKRLALVLLSFAGIIMAMVGIMELATAGMGGLYPPAWRFPGYAWILTVGGYLLMIPMGWLYLRDMKSEED